MVGLDKVGNALNLGRVASMHTKFHCVNVLIFCILLLLFPSLLRPPLKEYFHMQPTQSND